jgi:hypothetical protein
MLMRSRADQFSIAIFLLASLSFLYSFLFIFPFVPTQGGSWDSLLYMAPGQRMFEGQMIYRDVFEFVTPGTALVNLAMFKLFGLKLWIPNLLAMLLGLGQVWLGIVVSRKLMRPGLALLPSAIFLVSAHGFLCDATHHWYSVLATIAGIAILLEKRSAARIAVAGMLCGISASFTQTRGLAVILGFAFFLWWESRQSGEGWRALFRKELWLLAGCFSGFLAMNGYVIWEAGPARYFWCTVVYVLKDYPKLASANTFQVVTAELPSYTSFLTFLHPFAQWLYLTAVIPLVYVLFFVHYLRRRRQMPVEYWTRPMLVAIVGFFMFLSIVPAPDYVRMMASMLPALIVLVWLLDSPTRLARASVAVLAAGALLAAIWSIAARRPNPVGILETPQGALAFTQRSLYVEDLWIQQHTQPSDYFYKPAYPDDYFYLNLRNPTPLPFIENDGYTTQEQVTQVIQSLEQRQVRYILWNPQVLDTIPTWENPSDAHLGPLRDYLHRKYGLIKVFPDDDQIWQRTTQ